MKTNWKRLATTCTIASIILFGGPPAIRWSLGAIHQYKVQQADGVWCAQFSPEGKQTTLYGEEACGL